MKISEIYKKYPINKGLQEHMIRVAAVAKMVCDHTSSQVDEKLIVTTCLLHDIGNLAKADFSLPNIEQYFAPEGVEYWKAAQEELWSEISKDEYVVTESFLRDIGVSESVIAAVLNIELAKLMDTAANKTLEDQVILYADLRVGLSGIVSVQERMDDIRNRYVPARYSDACVDQALEHLLRVEEELFASADIVPSDLTDASTANIQKKLMEFEIKL